MGYKAAIGFTPAELRAVFGGPSDGTEVVTRLLRFDYAASEKLHLTLEAPLEVNWRKPQAQWSFALGISYALSTPRLVAGSTLLRHEEKAERKDEAWVPPPAPYGRLQGRIATLYGVAGVTVTTPPADTVPGTNYGLGMLGAEMSWDRDRWGGRYAFTPAVSLEAGIRRTSGESAYFTGTLGLGVRWYFLGPLGLSVTAVRVEGGPRVRGGGDVDTSQGVHGSPSDAYYLQAGSRIGVALRLGIFDLLVEAPTIAWTSDPFGAGEILSFRLGLRLK